MEWAIVGFVALVVLFLIHKRSEKDDSTGGGGASTKGSDSKDQLK